MHPDLLRLTEIAKAKTRTIIGLMSGTSLDGLDISLCEFQGEGSSTKVKLLQFRTCPYNEAFKAELKSVSSKPQVDLQKVTLLHAYLGSYHAELILAALNDWNVSPKDVDLIASHGQTIYHAPFRQHQTAPYSNATLQIGDADHIAVKTGIITISDFRQKHVAAGGEGAPLAGYGDYLMFSSKTENRLLLNIGGIANFSYLPARNASKRQLTTDTGPGNTLMDQFVQYAFPGKQYDANGELASKGRVNQQLIAELMKVPFFSLPFPKTTGPEIFSLAYLHQALSATGLLSLNPQDILATLAELTRNSVAAAIKNCVPADDHYKIYISGGGMHNAHLAKALSLALNKPLHSTAELDVDPDAKEAVLFALLANECISGQREAIETGDPQMPAVSMGKISLTC